MKFLFTISAVIALLYSNILAQSNSNWNVFPSYSTVNDMAIDLNMLAAATNGGIFIVNDEEEIITFNSLDGLYKSNPSAIIFDQKQDYVITGYLDGMLQRYNVVTSENELVSDIYRNSRYSSKEIRKLIPNGNQLFVVTSFGLVVYNTDSFLVANSFTNIGEFDSGIEILDADIGGENIIVATPDGVGIGNLSENLVERENWQSYLTNAELPSHNLRQVITFDSGFFVLMSDNKVYRLTNNGNWEVFEPLADQNIKRITKLDDQKLVSISSSQLFITSDTGDNEILDLKINSSVTSIEVRDDDIYLGTVNEGVNSLNIQTNVTQQFLPTGPYLNFFTNIHFDGALISASTKEFPQSDPLNMFRGYYIYDGEQWNNYNINTSEDLKLKNVGLIYSASSTDDAYFFGSWGGGVIEHTKADNAIKIYDSENSILRGINAGPAYIVISDIHNDTNNNIWAVSYNSEFPLNVKISGSNEWSRFRNLSGNDNYFKLFIDSYDQKWITLISTNNTGLGLLVIDTGNIDEPADDVAIKLTSTTDNLPDNKINAIVQDKNEEVWIGTNRGIARFIFPELMIEGSSQERRAQWLINEDTTAASRFLLRDIHVTSMAVNEANEKWVGTLSQGLYLLNDQGSRIKKHFTEENSDLISNNINSLTIDHSTGEVFVATDLGLVSFIDVAKTPVNKMDELKVYPNPFRYNDHKRIWIDGLANATTIKILSVDGFVVNEINAEGGRIEWDGYNYNGNKLGSGVYYTVAYDNNGNQKGLGKIVIIN